MFSFLRRLISARTSSATPKAAELPFIDRNKIRHLIVAVENLPHVDWGMADAWINHQLSIGEWTGSAAALRRAIAAAWLDELRDAFTTESRRWRSINVEGVAALGGNAGQRIATCAERSFAVIGHALRDIRGDARTNPIPPIGIIAPATHDEYYSFVSHFYTEEGEYATSGGLYINQGMDSFPILVIDAQPKWGLEHTVAHELTHHALQCDCESIVAGTLPVWVEEGLTQMMEEHVTRDAIFSFDHHMLSRHRALWEEIGLDGFTSGETFQSAEGEQQELSYNLAQAITRLLATERKNDLFAFVRACRSQSCDPELAEREHLGSTIVEIAERFLWDPR